MLSAHVWQTQCTLAHELAGFLYCKQDALHELWPDSCSTSAMPLHELACFMCLARAVHELVCFMDHNCKAPCTSWPTSGIAEYVDGDSEDIDFLTRALPSFIVRQRTTPLCHSSCHLLTFLHLTGIVPAISDACMWSHSVLVVYHPDFEKCRDQQFDRGASHFFAPVRRTTLVHCTSCACASHHIGALHFFGDHCTRFNLIHPQLARRYIHS